MAASWCARARFAGGATPRSAIRGLRSSRAPNGLAVGPRPESGVFQGDRFLHPVLGFEIRFPSGWRTTNTNQMVGAMEPKGEAMVYLTGDLPPGGAQQVAETWLARARQEAPLEVREAASVKVGPSTPTACSSNRAAAAARFEGT